MDADTETVIQLALSTLQPFPNHPFRIRDDNAMSEMVESVKTYGVVNPILVRPHSEDSYVIISGHRRKHACEVAKLEQIPAIIRNVDDDTAVILMVDSNLQRENILPSERAYAYKMKLEAMKRQGKRGDLTSPQLAAKFRSDDTVANGENISGDTVRRYVRLTRLAPELLQMVDDKKISLTPAVEISYLQEEEQTALAKLMEATESIPSLVQAQQLKKLSQSKELDANTMRVVLRGNYVPPKTLGKAVDNKSNSTHEPVKVKLQSEESLQTVRKSDGFSIETTRAGKTGSENIPQQVISSGRKAEDISEQTGEESDSQRENKAEDVSAETERKNISRKTSPSEKKREDTAPKTVSKWSSNQKSAGTVEPFTKKSTATTSDVSIPGLRGETFEESVARLKDMNKDCRCTPEVFCATFKEFASNCLRSVERYASPYYAAVFPDLNPEQLQEIQRQIQVICTALEQFCTQIERNDLSCAMQKTLYPDHHEPLMSAQNTMSFTAAC